MITVPRSWSDTTVHTVTVPLRDKEKSCLSKNYYRTEALAQKVVRKAALRGTRLRYYGCIYCKGYHLTHVGVTV